MLAFLLERTLEGRLKFIRQQELESDDSEETTTSTSSSTDQLYDLSAGLANFTRVGTTVNITEDPGSESGTGKRKFNKHAPKEVSTEDNRGKGFAGTSLMLFPNVRETKVDLGEKSSWFGLFGIDKRVGTLITMYLGPNRRTNRYLTYQYIRLIKSIGGEIVKETRFSEHTQTHYVIKSVH
jgi:hypothetical protein